MEVLDVDTMAVIMVDIQDTESVMEAALVMVVSAMVVLAMVDMADMADMVDMDSTIKNSTHS